MTPPTATSAPAETPTVGAAEEPADATTGSDAEAPGSEAEAGASGDEVVGEELLVEEVSIDGMCGVY